MADLDITKEAFLARVKELGLPGNDQRLDALYQDVRIALQRIAGLHDIDTTGVEPSGTAPRFEWGES